MGSALRLLFSSSFATDNVLFLKTHLPVRMPSTMAVTHAIQKAPYTKPLNWDLHTNPYGEPCIPFSLYVRSERTTSYTALPGFWILPAELQIRILYFCDAPTLFRLMHVSTAMRVEAKKLFWSFPDTWYLVEGHWLLFGGFPSEAYYATDFQLHAERLEVDFPELNVWLGEDDIELAPQPYIFRFWKTLQRRFPRVNNVILSESFCRSAEEPLPYVLEMVAEMCPGGINVSTSYIKRAKNNDFRLERSLWQRNVANGGISDGWENVDQDWTRQSILLPPKKFCGPVGAYERSGYIFNRLQLRESSQRALIIEAIERQHFHERYEPFSCCYPTCEVEFKQPGECISHSFESNHYQDAHPPVEMKAAFDQHSKELERIREDAVREGVEEGVGEEGSEQRRKLEQAFLHQLDRDPSYAHERPAKGSRLWFNYNQFLSVTHAFRDYPRT